MAGQVSFIGREEELSALLGALDGDARLVLVVGDAGVGKTRFTAEGMKLATAAGMVMIRGECLPLSDTLPLHPVADALGELARLADGRVLAGALEAAPGYVRQEVRRLLPGLNGGETAPNGRGGEWSQQRLFTAVAELLAAVAARSSGAGLVVEDVHWADSATLDCLTVLARPGRLDGIRMVVTCRGDEAPLAGHVAGWLAQVRADAGVQEIRLGPLSPDQAARQVAALAGGPVPAWVVDEVYARAEGNPFFTEQLVAAALGVGGETRSGDGLRLPAGLPARLAELLAARAARCVGDARAVLAGLAVVGRPLGEDMLGQVTGLEEGAVARALRELATARLLAEGTPRVGYRPRHALLGEAVAAGLLPGERAVLHERTARALAGDQAQAADVAAHWQAAGRPAEELPARMAAAEAAERVFGYAQAAAHWQRAIDLAQPDAPAAIDLPRLYVRAAEALLLSGDSERAGLLAEDAYRRYASHPDPATAAVALHRAAYFRALGGDADVLPLIEQAVRLFEQAPPSFDHARAMHDIGYFLVAAEGRPEAALPMLNRALEIAEAAGVTALIPRILASIGKGALWRGQIEEGLATYERARALAQAAQDGPALVVVVADESDVLLKLARFQRAAEAATRGLDAARQAGLQSWELTGFLAANGAEALLALGRTAEAAALIDPLTTGPPDRDHWFVHALRAEIDLLRGEAGAATGRLRLIFAFPAVVGRVEYASEAGRRAAEAALWAGRPGEALEEVQRVLTPDTSPDMTIFCGRLLAAGMWACADLAERARARREEPGIRAAMAAADGLASWVGQMGGVPFADHPYMAAIPAERVTWDAERTRLAGSAYPETWAGVAKAWQDLDCPHRAAYAWWRQAQAQLDAGQPAAAAAAALRAAADAADGHAPLQAQIAVLADRVRIPLQPPAAPESAGPQSAAAPASYGLTSRELAVLRLLADGRTNAQIGAELYISPKTAGVHVSNIVRKLGVSGRVQAAAVAERAGLLRPGPQP